MNRILKKFGIYLMVSFMLYPCTTVLVGKDAELDKDWRIG
jgi:hypothetical protein